MKALIINVVCGIRSTGRICTDLATELESKGYEVKIAYGRGEVPPEYIKYAVRIGNKLDNYWHVFATRIFDRHGLASKLATKRFLHWAEEYNPDLLWLHNIHGYFMNYEMLFAWIKSRPDMQVRWTLHDCWAFTGHCAYFTAAGCEKWRMGCNNCPEKRKYPQSNIADNSEFNYCKKKSAFTGVNNLQIITPSEWLANLVKESFLKDYPVEVRYNTIDTSVFKPTQSDFRGRYHLEDKKIILGVASTWDERKGLNDFLELSKRLDGNYQIVLVGLKENIPGIITIPEVRSKQELAGIYTAADVFINPTHEDNYPTVNLEAQACGTPCISYDTGGCAETIRIGKLVERLDVHALAEAIKGFI